MFAIPVFPEPITITASRVPAPEEEVAASVTVIDGTAIVRLGETFDLDLVAEGVETEEQRLALRRMGCQGGQGFLYSRAVPPADAEAYIAANSAVELPRTVAALN